MGLNSTNEHGEKANATIADLLYLKSVFGPVLVPLKDDVQTRDMVIRSFDPLPMTSIALEHGETSTQLFGIVAGPVSGLLAIGFSSEEILTQFLNDNPTLTSAIVLRTQSEYLLWLRPLNGLPPSVVFEGFRIVSSGVIPGHCAELGVKMSIYQQGTVPDVDLASIVFTGQIAEYIREFLLQLQFGRPLIRINRRRSELNVIFWAARLTQLTGLRFDVERQVFVAPGEQKGEIILESKLPAIVATFLHQSNQGSHVVPLYEIRPDRIRAIVSALKTFCAISTPGESEIMAQFLDLRVEHSAGGVLFKTDAVVAYQEFRRTNGLPPGSINRLRCHLTVGIKEHFRIGESHDLLRGGRSQRGFRGLRLRSMSADSLTTGPESVDASETESFPKPKTAKVCAECP